MKKMLIPIFVILVFVLSFLPQDAHATTVFTLDQTTCESILYPGIWDAVTNTCTLSGVVHFGTDSGPHVLELVIPSGNTLTISSNHGFFTDFDTITNNGTINLVNQGGLAVTNGGVLNNNGILNNNAPYLQNGAGTINNNVGASINNNGRFTNYFSIINNHGVLNAGSDLENQAGGIINNYCPGVINGGIIGTPAVNLCLTATTTTLSSDPNSSTFGQSVLFTATVNPSVSDGTPVAFFDGATQIGTGSTTNNVATFSISTLAVGSHAITAKYSGDANHQSSTSSIDTVTVNTLVCPVGSFLPSGSNTCTPAPAGSFVSTTGATSASLCPVGTFQPLAGQSSCNPSPAGSFVSTTGATSASLCTPGSFQPLAGQSSCLLAQPGFFVNSTGAIQQTQCPAGTNSAAGAISCYIVDTTPPAVSITQPSDGSVLNHISSINGTASDDTSVSSVIVSIDGGLPTTATYSSGTWTLATTLSNGTHTANATATDSVGLETKTGIIHFTILTPTQGRITGGGHVGQDQNFGFEVKSDSDSKKITSGHIEYHDKSKKMDLDSKQITILSVYDSSTHAAFVGQGTIHDKDKTLYNLLVQVSDPDKSGDHDTFSITITDKTGAVVYHNSGIVHGHIEIHKFSDHDDKSDSGNQHGGNFNNDNHNNSH
ncbi:MAG TPA: Ig-like domain repeat protein [Candidatus Nitrosotalea sp.]|nr:Ig-like domain repeat protein [Candidatus Nitrosotalea sp.]